MPIFKTGLKIIAKALPIIFANFLAFMILAIAISFVQQSPYEFVKIDIGIINHDVESDVVLAIKDCLSPIADFVEVGDTNEEMQDALFHQKVDAVLIFPQGYSQSFFQAEPLKLEKVTQVNSYAGFQIDAKINLFVNTINTYINVANQTQSQAIQSAKIDTIKTIDVEQGEMWKNSQLSSLQVYCNFAVMLLSSILGTIVATIMLPFKERATKMRNECSPKSKASVTWQMILATAVFIVIFVLIYIGVAMIVYPNAVFTISGLWMIINVIALTVSITGISYLVGTFMKNYFAVSFCLTMLSLIMSFAGGGFIPQSLLHPVLRTIGYFTPAGWFVNNITTCSTIKTIAGSHLTSMLIGIGVQIAFGIATILVALTVSKIKRKEA